LPGSVEINGINNELILTSRLVDTDSTVADDLLTFFQLCRKPAPLVFKQHRWQLGLVILESKVYVAGKWLSDSGYFTLYPDKAKFTVKQMTNLTIYL
jgi:hypothetical protein